MRLLPTTRREIFCNDTHNVKVIDRSIIDPDDNFLTISDLGKSLIGKLLEGEIVTKLPPTTLLQIFCDNICNLKVMEQSNIDPEDKFLRSNITVLIFSSQCITIY